MNPSPPPLVPLLLRAARHDDVDKVVRKNEAAGRRVGRYLGGDRPHAGRQDRRHEALAFADQFRAAQRFAGKERHPGDRSLQLLDGVGVGVAGDIGRIGRVGRPGLPLEQIAKRLAHRHVAVEHQHFREADGRLLRASIDHDFGRRCRNHVLGDVAGAARRSHRHPKNDHSGCSHNVQTLPGNPPSQAGHCSANRQITVNATLTIVINLRFMKMLPIGLECGRERDPATGTRRSAVNIQCVESNVWKVARSPTERAASPDRRRARQVRARGRRGCRSCDRRNGAGTCFGRSRRRAAICGTSK